MENKTPRERFRKHAFKRGADGQCATCYANADHAIHDTPAQMLDALTPASSRCGHNFQIPKCPYKHCAARELYEAAVKARYSIGIHVIEPFRSDVMKGIDAILAKARGES